VVKEANTLATAGFKVTILTTFTSKELLEEDLKLIDTSLMEYRGIINLIPGQSSKWYQLRQRILRRIACEVIEKLKCENILALGHDYRANLNAAVREQADLYICHQEMSTVIGHDLIKRGFKVAFDFEDWYSHDLLPEANQRRPIKLLEKYEKYALQKSVLSYTTSNCMAAALATFAGVVPPSVLYNVFPLAERNLLDGKIKDRKNRSRASLYWHSQTIGPGRGLEFFVKSLHQVDIPIELHLRGNCSEDFKNQLSSFFPSEKGHELFFHQLVPHKELLSRVAEHDIGLATEDHFPESRNLTITNKIFQYLLGGIAVIASDTAGQKELAATAANAVLLYENYNSNDLAKQINSLIMDKERLRLAKQSALTISATMYCHEQQEKLLVDWVNAVV
jgi:hypothetical protein